MPNDPTDELQIRNLIARLAHAADTATEAELDSTYVPLFTTDSVWEAQPGALAPGQAYMRNDGVAAIRAAAAGRRQNGTGGPGSNAMHLVTTSVITVTGDEATGESCFIVVRGELQISVAGRYRDRYRREDGTWRIAHRTVCPR